MRQGRLPKTDSVKRALGFSVAFGKSAEQSLTKNAIATNAIAFFQGDNLKSCIIILLETIEHI